MGSCVYGTVLEKSELGHYRSDGEGTDGRIGEEVVVNGRAEVESNGGMHCLECVYEGGIVVWQKLRSNSSVGSLSGGGTEDRDGGGYCRRCGLQAARKCCGPVGVSSADAGHADGGKGCYADVLFVPCDSNHVDQQFRSSFREPIVMIILSLRTLVCFSDQASHIRFVACADLCELSLRICPETTVPVISRVDAVNVVEALTVNSSVTHSTNAVKVTMNE